MSESLRGAPNSERIIPLPVLIVAERQWQQHFPFYSVSQPLCIHLRGWDRAAPFDLHLPVPYPPFTIISAADR